MELEEACTFLRDFTLGKRGFTQRDGAAGMQRVHEVCDRLKEGFSEGAHAQEVTTAVASAKANVEAAKARLALLKARD